MADLNGQTAIVTGASRGIGEAAARRLARAGAHVVLAARSADAIRRVAAEIGSEGGKASAQTCDVTNAEEVRELVDLAVGRTGRLDILVNNAGTIDPIARLEDSDPEAWSQGFGVNAVGVYHGLRFAAPVMKAAGRGVIVNISSGAATSPLEGWSHYCAGKAAALMLTACADQELRTAGLRVVGLSPGTVATAMQTAIRASGVNPVSRLDPAAHIPPEWVAQAIEWLCVSAEADAWRGRDFSLRTDESRRAVGLPAVGAR